MKITKYLSTDAGKWFIEVKYDWRVIALNWHWPEWKFGYAYTWYDGPHKSFDFGLFNVYWNF